MKYGFTYKSPNITKDSTNYGFLWDSLDTYFKLNNYEFDCRYPETPWVGMWINKKYNDSSDRILFLDGSIKVPKVSSVVKDLFNLELHKKYVELKIENTIKRFFLIGGIDINLLLIDHVYKHGFNFITNHLCDTTWKRTYEDLLNHYSGEYGVMKSFDIVYYSNLNTENGDILSIPLVGIDNQLKNNVSRNELIGYIEDLKSKLDNPNDFSDHFRDIINIHDNHTGINKELFYFSTPHFDNIQYHEIVPHNLYNEFIDTFRNPENEIRVELGLPKIGEGWVSETKLFYLIKERFFGHRVIQHGKPRWLGKQHLDIYLPEFNIGIEYQGEQHTISVEIFGGSEGLKNNIQRDLKKKKLCQENGLKLYEVYPDDDFTRFVDMISELYLK